MFGFLCNPLFVTKQVTIRVHNLKYAPEEAEKESSILNQPVLNSSRKKPLPSQSFTANDNNRALESAFTEYVFGIELKEESYQEFEMRLLLSQSVFLSYSQLSPSSCSCSPIMKLLSQPFSTVSPINQNSVCEGCKGFLLLLQRWEMVGPACDQFPRSVCSLEKLLFCTDVLLSSLQRASSSPALNKDWLTMLSTLTRQVTHLIVTYLYDQAEDKQGSCILAYGQVLIKIAQLMLLLLPLSSDQNEAKGLQSSLAIATLSLRQLAGDECLSVYLLLSLLMSGQQQSGHSQQSQSQHSQSQQWLLLCLPGLSELSQELLVTMTNRQQVLIPTSEIDCNNDNGRSSNDHALCLLLSSLRPSSQHPSNYHSDSDSDSDSNSKISFHARFLLKCVQYRLRISSSQSQQYLSPSHLSSLASCSLDRLYIRPISAPVATFTSLAILYTRAISLAVIVSLLR